MAAVTLYLIVTTVILVAMYIKYFYRRRREGEPPIVPGHFLFGNGADFSRHAVHFLQQCQKQFGDIFTIRLLNQFLTIIMDPHSYENMTKEKKFDFDPIQRQVNHNVFSFELTDARQMIKEAGKTVRGSYLTRGMRNFSEHLNEAFLKIRFADVNGNKRGGEDGWRSDGLRTMTSKTLFAAMFYTIFGRSDDPEFEPLTVYKNFDIFHKYFNYLWLGLPIKLFPRAVDALTVLCKQPLSDEVLGRSDVSDYIRYSTEFMKAHGQTEQDIKGHNLVYLHVNYNTFRLAFWCLHQIIDNPQAYNALRQEIQDAVDAKIEETGSGDEPLCFMQENFEKLPILESIIKESLRICSGVFMVRYIVDDVDFEMDDGKKHSLRKGDRVAIYPPAIHKDPEIFANPEVFQYDRFVDAKFYKNGREVKIPLIAFGSLCPGKRYALMQAKWFLFALFNKFDMRFLNDERAELDIRYHGHEILPPVKDVQIEYRKRSNRRELLFI